MPTSEYRAVDAESDLPISAAELAALANQLVCRQRPPGIRQVRHSRRRSRRAATCRTRRRLRRRVRPRRARRLSSLRRFRCSVSPMSTFLLRRLRTPSLPPQTVPVAPRGNVPDTTAVPSAATTTGGIADPYLPPADLSAFAVPTEGIVPTLPGVLAGTVPGGPSGSARRGAILAGRGAVGGRPRLTDTATTAPIGGGAPGR